MTGPVISQEYFLKNRLLLHLGFDRSGWMVLIKSEILITTGIVWPVSSDKRKARMIITMLCCSGLVHKL